MIPIKRNILFFLQKRKNGGYLKCRVRWSKNIVEFNLGYLIDIDKWISESQSCKSNTTHGLDKVPASDINRAIRDMSDDLDSVFYDFEILDEVPTKDQLRDAYNILVGKLVVEKKEFDLFEAYDEFVRVNALKNSWSGVMVQKYNSLKRHLYNFDRRLKFEDITESKLSAFVRYFQTTKALKIGNLEGSHGLRNTTIKGKLGFVRTFLRWCYENDYYKGNLHLTFRPKFKGLNMKEVVFLNWSELMTLYNFEFEEESLNRVRDIFCFCCFSSLRYSDVSKLTRDEVFEDYISVVTQKTEDKLVIELNKYSRAILDRYKDVDFPDNLALPVISNQRMNDHLKIMGRKCKFNETIKDVYFVGSERFEETYKKWELLTTHCGRRSFVVNSLYLGIPAEVVMKWTGHKDFESMKPYIAIVDDLKKREMDKFNHA